MRYGKNGDHELQGELNDEQDNQDSDNNPYENYVYKESDRESACEKNE